MKKWHEWKMQEKTRTLLKHYSGFTSPKTASMPKNAPLPGIVKSKSLRTFNRNNSNNNNNDDDDNDNNNNKNNNNKRREARRTMC